MKYTFDWKEYANTARRAVAEGCVLLRNENQALPVRPGESIAVFGRSQFNYYKSGTGSGGMVNTPYVVSILDALRQEEQITLNQELLKVYEDWVLEHPFDEGKGWANEPWCQEEMELTGEVAAKAAVQSDIALVIIARTAGEDRDNYAGEGSYLLTKKEEQMLEAVCNAFTRVAVLLNVGNIIDMKFVEKYNPQAVMYVWQGGMEGGHGVADVLTGRVSPSGHLTDTIAADISDYPSTAYFGDEFKSYYKEDIYVGYRYFETAAKDKVLFPFGFGLSYTVFEQQICGTSRSGDEISIEVSVTNTGEAAGKDTVQVYYQPAQGRLAKPVRNLIGFAKTGVLQPGESQTIAISFDIKQMASYDDSGVTGYPNSFLLEAGEYRIYAGCNVREAVEAMRIELEERVVEQLEEACAPVEGFKRMVLQVNEDGSVTEKTEEVPVCSISLADRIADRRPAAAEYTGDMGYRFKDLMEHRVTMEEYLAQLTDEDLVCMARGEGMCSSKVTSGIAGSFGGVTASLQRFGMPIGGCADGPSGIRMDCGTIAFSNPNGTLMACTFNVELAEQLYQWEGMELLLNKIDSLLGPGINIHRNPLNGRNFEYFSEDPYLTGRMAAAMLRGMAKYGVTGTIKHFAANSQEFSRHTVDSIVSQRALREIYLKAFEIAVKEGNAYSIMTTYNPLNGIWNAGNYDLVTTILRKEWGYDGMVMTDWWAKINEKPGDASDVKKLSAMIRAQNDVFMVVSDAASNPLGDDGMDALQSGRITRGELLRNASNILSVLMRSPAGRRVVEDEPEFEILNAPQLKERKKNIMKPAEILEEGCLDLMGLKTEAGSDNQFAIRIPNRGVYTMKMKLKSDLGQLSQSSMTIMINNVPQYTITINGTGGEWVEREVDMESFAAIDSYIDFVFAQSGIEVGEIKIVRKGKLLGGRLELE